MRADLIDRQAAIDKLETVGYDFSNSGLSEIELEEVCEAVGDVRQDMISMIKRLPSAQPEIEIIRCRDCKYYKEYGYVNGKPKFLPKCGFHVIYPEPDDFCSTAERRTDE